MTNLVVVCLGPITAVRAKRLANIVSSALIMASIFMLWIRYNTGPALSAIQTADASFAPNASLAVSLVVAGGIISLLSRYGGLLTMAGVWLFVAIPPERFLFVASNVVITSSFETGVWLAWAGASISLLGSSWTLPFGLLTTEANRKKLGMILFPLGVVTAVFGALIPLPVSIVLILTGFIALGVSLILLLPRQRRTLAQILKSFGRGDKHDQSELEEIGQ